MGKIILYGMEASPPVRTVLLTLNALDLSYEFVEVNLLNNEHKTREFLKKNPQHTIPVLEDDGHFYWDSHAIAAYLVRKYGKNDALYPRDFQKRAVVDQRLHFDSGVLFASLIRITSAVFFKNITVIPTEKIEAVKESLEFLECFLNNDYVAGDSVTIADFSLISTVTNLNAITPIDGATTPKVLAWINRMSELPYYQLANRKGAAVFDQLFKNKIASG